jgi:hypothetical protein
MINVVILKRPILIDIVGFFKILFRILSFIYYIIASNSQLEDIFNTVDRLQQFRLEDQRTNFPKHPQRSPLNEQFFDQLAKCQVRFKMFLKDQSLSLYLGFTYE